MTRRVDGLDVARGIALLGMFAAHTGDAGTRGIDADGWPWLVIFDGRSSALFAMLAGVSIALMLAHREAAQGSADAARHTRIRVAVRAGMLIVLGWVLAAFATPVDVILDNLGVMFLLVLPALRWHPGAQAGLGVVLLAFGSRTLNAWDPAATLDPPVLHELWSPHYPALVWCGYVLVGMAIGRWRPWRGAGLGMLAGAGAVLAAGAYGAGLALGGTFAEDDSSWSSLAPHSYTGFEMLGNLGAAVLVAAASLLVAPHARRLLWPLAAAGRMTLTLYSLHIVVIAAVGREMVWEPSSTAWLSLSLGALALASVWRAMVGQGPLERVLTFTSNAAADAVEPRAKVAGPAA